jgi:aspartate racemase
MEQEFYRERFRRQGIAVLIPDRAARTFVHDLIYNELCAGKLLPESREGTLRIMSELQRNGAEAIVLACTELPLLIRAQDTTLRLFDTMALHVEKAVTLALSK